MRLSPLKCSNSVLNNSLVVILLNLIYNQLWYWIRKTDVVILGLNEFERYSYENKEKILYTLLTRSREGVYMYCNKEVPEIISNVDTNLYDFVK